MKEGRFCHFLEMRKMVKKFKSKIIFKRKMQISCKKNSISFFATFSVEERKISSIFFKEVSAGKEKRIPVKMKNPLEKENLQKNDSNATNEKNHHVNLSLKCYLYFIIVFFSFLSLPANIFVYFFIYHREYNNAKNYLDSNGF